MNYERCLKVLAQVQYLKFSSKPISDKLQIEAVQAQTLLDAMRAQRKQEQLSKQEKKNMVDHFESKDRARKIPGAQ